MIRAYQAAQLKQVMPQLHGMFDALDKDGSPRRTLRNERGANRVPDATEHPIRSYLKRPETLYAQSETHENSIHGRALALTVSINLSASP